MNHLLEDDLIAYHLDESAQAESIALHLEVCAECAATSESIAETLRVFSAEPVPAANVEHAWQRLRGNLPRLGVPQRPARHRWSTRLAFFLVPLMGVLLVAMATTLLRQRLQHRWPTYANNRPGPLTNEPVGSVTASVEAQGIANVNTHLDSAERLLTEVNHTTGPLDVAAQQQARNLLVRNALYVQQAHTSGDLAQASLLEHLGRVLTTLDHEQAEHGQGWHLRFEMSTSGLLLDLRILQQNSPNETPVAHLAAAAKDTP